MKHMIELFRQGRYNVISERMIEVDNQTVQEVMKKGRGVITCSCENSSRFAHSNICRHKKFFILLPFLLKTEQKLSNLLDYFKVNKDICKTEEAKKLSEIICMNLNDLKRFE